ncbi:unnamed protein product [Lactuca virosa]|uniref:Uncharacterized protein n=1 Tax=Lactuca virosa TaxID=75947 RepID=A0AAU9LKL5_9ASTR|nr:unnamed protein product [Lactuca virosa]
MVSLVGLLLHPEYVASSHFVAMVAGHHHDNEHHHSAMWCCGMWSLPQLRTVSSHNKRGKQSRGETEQPYCLTFDALIIFEPVTAFSSCASSISEGRCEGGESKRGCRLRCLLRGNTHFGGGFRPWNEEEMEDEWGKGNNDRNSLQGEFSDYDRQVKGWSNKGLLPRTSLCFPSSKTSHTFHNRKRRRRQAK